MKNLLLQRKAGIALLTIDRTEVSNALDQETYNEFGQAIDEIRDDSSIRVMVITGAGRAFCAGVDLNFASFIRNLNKSDFRTTLQKIQNTFRFETLDIPVISAVNGFALGNGCDIALASDIIFASEKAIFSMAYTNLGLIPDLGGTFRLSRLVGTVMAKEIILTGEKIRANKALSIGMINRVLPPEKLMPETMAFAEQLAKRAPIALSLAKKAINTNLGTDLDSSILLEANLQNICMQSEDLKEAIAAFMEKREPEFMGQ